MRIEYNKRKVLDKIYVYDLLFKKVSGYQLIAIGNIITNKCLKASESISDKDIDVLSVIKSDCLQELNIDIKKYHKVLVYCAGYCDIIRGELSKKFDTTKWLFKGYNDSTYGTYRIY